LTEALNSITQIRGFIDSEMLSCDIQPTYRQKDRQTENHRRT